MPTRVRRAHVGPVGEKRGGDPSDPAPGERGVERCVSFLVSGDGAHVGARREQDVDGVGSAEERGEMQRRPAVRRVSGDRSGIRPHHVAQARRVADGRRLEDIEARSPGQQLSESGVVAPVDGGEDRWGPTTLGHDASPPSTAARSQSRSRPMTRRRISDVPPPGRRKRASRK